MIAPLNCVLREQRFCEAKWRNASPTQKEAESFAPCVMLLTTGRIIIASRRWIMRVSPECLVAEREPRASALPEVAPAGRALRARQQRIYLHNLLRLRTRGAAGSRVPAGSSRAERALSCTLRKISPNLGLTRAGPLQPVAAAARLLRPPPDPRPRMGEKAGTLSRKERRRKEQGPRERDLQPVR